MIVIRTMADVQSLKDDRHLPSFYIEAIYNQFLGTYEAVAESEKINDFSLDPNACIYHFDKESDLEMLVRLTENI